MVTVYLGELRFPVSPESVRFLLQSGNRRETAIGTGEVTFPGKAKQRTVMLKGYFPGKEERERFPFAKKTPEEYGKLLEGYFESGKAVRFSISGNSLPCSFPATVEECTLLEEPGGSGLSFELTLKEYREAARGSSAVKPAGQTVTVRPDLRKREQVVRYTVKSGDTLWTIAREYLGDGSRYMEIAALNGIANPNLIFAGQEVTIRL